MYADAQKTLEDILGLVERCPANLREKCFELLLKAYLDSKVTVVSAAVPGVALHPTASSLPKTSESDMGTLPDALKSRFTAAAGRMGVQVQQLAGLFDFQLDPYNYHALSVPGENKADKCRNVGLLLCAKAYLTMSDWSADWKEFRAVCIDQMCWDQANAGTHLGKSGLFKTYSAADGLVCAGKGIEAAQALLAQLILGPNAVVK